MTLATARIRGLASILILTSAMAISTPRALAQTDAATRPIETMMLLRSLCLKDEATRTACRPKRESLLATRDRLCSNGPKEFCESLQNKPPSERFKVVNTRDCEGVYNVIDFEQFSPHEYYQDSLGYDIAMRALGCKALATTAEGRNYECRNIDPPSKLSLETGAAILTKTADGYHVRIPAQIIAGFDPSSKGPVDSETRQLFSRVAMITPNYVDGPYRNFIQETYTPERIAALKNHFAIARDSMLKYLATLDPKPPAQVLARIRDAHLNLPPADLKTIEEGCGYGSTAAGATNAWYSPMGNGTVTVCPASLLSLEYANPRALIGILLHEFGHAFDPCTLGRNAMDSKAASKASPKVACAKAVDAAASATGPGTFFARMNSLAGCLKDHSDIGDGFGRNIISNELPDSISAFAKSHPKIKLSEEARCYAISYGSAGPLRSCNVTAEFRNKMADELGKLTDKIGFTSPDSQAAVELDAKAVDMMNKETAVGEASADYVASKALGFAIADPRYLQTPLSGANEEDRVAEALTAGLGSWCLIGEAEPGSSHPTALLRASLMAQGSLRKTLGCRAPASGTGYPESACRLEGEPK